VGHLYYVYGVLHHPVYREKFAENLKRELPRIPLIGTVGAGLAPPSPDNAGDSQQGAASRPPTAPGSKAQGTASRTPTTADGNASGTAGRIPTTADGNASGKASLAPTPAEGTASRTPTSAFWTVSRIGKKLADLHVNYESLDPYPLEWLENKSVPLSCRVQDKMRLSKDKRSLVVNKSLTLGGIPSETFQYRLGNRSALEWVIDQYQVTEDAKSGIRSDPNRRDDPEYIVRLVGQVVRVSLETVRLVSSLPPLT
jgi:predicted helicase